MLKIVLIIIRKHQTNPIGGHSTKLLFRSVKVIKDKERLRNCHSLEETKETCQFKAMWESWIGS